MLNVTVAAHVHTPVIFTDLERYLKSRPDLASVTMIAHPLFTSNSSSSIRRYTTSTKAEVCKIGTTHKLPTPFQYIWELCWTIVHVMHLSPSQDVFIGIDPLNALAGLILRVMGKTKKTVFYVIDYSPQKYKNLFLNRLYHAAEQFCARHADATWNVSQRIITARDQAAHTSFPRQHVVPVGVWEEEFKPYVNQAHNQNRLVFMGSVDEKQGIKHILNILPMLRKKIPNIELLIVGGGSYLNQIKQIVQQLNITDCVKMTGYVAQNSDLYRHVASATLAVAPYERYIDGALSFTYFADPGKLKVYTACGVPIALTDVPHNAYELIDRGAAVLLDLANPEQMATTLAKTIQNKAQLTSMRLKAQQYAQKYAWSKILDYALNTVVKEKR